MISPEGECSDVTPIEFRATMTDPVAASSPEDDEREPLEGVDADFGFGRRRTGRPTSALVDPLVGATIGGVSLGSLIAEGGMGRVYLGRQLRPDRPVAVKVVKPGLFSSSALRRFERESQMLASLHHPGIAQIHSFGTYAAAGNETPYLVMEYITGAKTITDFANERGLNIRGRLELFRQVCDAVSHAHGRGILHRDLKPGNILVAEDGRPKIIDFGVARQLDRDTILTTAHEDIGRLIGTIQYMAPEQFRGDSRELDIRVDVYALGVVLYELLTGRPPFDLRQAVLAEAARVVLDEEPQALSFRDRALGRDIGLIARKCLQKNPQHRYASAHDLAWDIGCYLRGEPVLARAPSVGDQLMRACRRHRVEFAFLAGTLTVLLASFAWSYFSGRHWEGGPVGGSAVSRQIADDRGRAPSVALEREAVTVVPTQAAAGDELVDVDGVRGLMPRDGYLSFRCRALTRAAAAVLAKPICHLTLELQTMDVDVARALAAQRDGLTIAGIRSLPDPVFAAIARHRGGSLILDDVQSLSQTAAASLAGYGGWLNLAGVRDWGEGALEAIASHRGGMAIRVEGLSLGQARVLAGHYGQLYIIGIDGIDAAIARELVRHDGPLDLWKADGITPDAADLLRQHPQLRFPGR